MAENETTLTCAKPSYLRMKLWKVENGVSDNEPPETGTVSYGPDEETTLSTTHNAGNFNFTYALRCVIISTNAEVI